MLVDIRRYAFTLAEVLVTLGIIGVVAALTLPVVINKINERQNIVKWKKAYSVVANAFYGAKSEGIQVCESLYGSSRKCNHTDYPHDYRTQEFYQYFIKVLEPIDYCSSHLPFIDKKCFGSTTSHWYNVEGYVSLSGTKMWNYPFKHLSMLLKDGTVIYFGSLWYGPWIMVDVNGFQGNPNVYGKDLFAIWHTEDKILPLGAEGTPYFDNPSYGASACDKNVGVGLVGAHNASGGGCSAKYILE